MRILLTANVRWWNAEAAYAWEKGMGLKQRGHDVTMLGLPGSPVARRAERGGMSVLTTDRFNSVNPLSWYGTVKMLRAYIREKKVDVIDVHRSEGFALIAAAVRRTSAVLVRTRGDMRCPRRDPFNRMVHVYGCHGLAASGKAVAERMAYAFNLELHDIRIIYFGVDAIHFSPGDGSKLRREFGVGNDEFLVGMVGRADRVKGVGTYIQAAARVCSTRKHVKFLLAVKEDHPDLKVYREMVEKMGLSGKFIEIGYRNDIESVYRALDALVVSSMGSEANCRVTLEAMATGIPVVATRVGVIPEIIRDGKTGYLVEPGSVGETTAALEDLADNREWARTIGKEGRSLIEERYNRTTFAAAAEAFYLATAAKGK